MEIHASPSEVLINILVQLFNIALFFFLAIKYLSKPLAQAIETRAEKEKRLLRADETYKEIIADAKLEAQSIVAEASEHKRNIVEEAAQLSQKKAQEIIELAERKADDIAAQAAVNTDKMKEELEKSFTTSVKQTSELVLHKLFASKKDVQDDYLNTLVDELTRDAKL